MPTIGPDNARTSFIYSAPQSNQQRLRVEEDEAERRVAEPRDTQNAQSENTTTRDLRENPRGVGQRINILA